MTRSWSYGNEAADGRVSHSAAACYPIMVRAASAGLHLAPFDYSSFLFGPTGVFKTEMAALQQQHFSAGFDARHLPASFISTANSNEAIAAVAKDAVIAVDEFQPPASGSERDSMHRDASRFIRSQGNATGRGRLRPDGTSRPLNAHSCGAAVATRNVEDFADCGIRVISPWEESK